MATVDINNAPGQAGSSEGALAPLGQGLTNVPAMPWSYGMATRPEILTSKANPAELLYALRRRWPLAVALGLLVGGIIGGLLWLLMPIRAEVQAMLKVSRNSNVNQRDLPEAFLGNLDYDVFKRTQVALLKSHFVINDALRKSKVAKLPIVQKQKDAVAWLTSELLVDYPNEAEVMRIAMKGDNSNNQLITLVNEVVDSYLEQIVNGDAVSKVEYKRKLDNTVVENKKLLAEKHLSLEALEKSGAWGEKAILQKKMALTHLDELVRRRAFVETEISDIEMKLLMMKTQESSPTPMKVMPYQIDEEMRKDPDLVQSLRDLATLKRNLTLFERAAKRPNEPGLLQRRDQIAALEEEIEEKKAAIRVALIERFSVPGAKEGVSKEMIETQYKALLTKRAELEKECAVAFDQVGKIEESTSEIEARKAEIKTLAEITDRMSHESLLMEASMTNSPSRVLKIDDANLAPSTDAMRKYVTMGFGCTLGFGVMLFGIAFLEFQSRRLNTPHDVNDGLGIRVMGDLPPLSGRAARRMASGKASVSLQAMLAESVDNIRTSLIHTNSMESPRVVMVTSAEPQEGKTTVATQLAASLARSGRKTLLIDGDLRSPAAHRVFDLALEPGLCEFLRGEVQPQAIVYPTSADNLWLLPAGHCDLRSVQALANDRVAALFDSLRAQFDFIIMDAGPVLKVADTLLLGQHVDAAILSVLRNFSKVPKIYEACERLKSVGVTVLGSVVNGVSGHAPRGVDLHAIAAQTS